MSKLEAVKLCRGLNQSGRKRQWYLGWEMLGYDGHFQRKTNAKNKNEVTMTGLGDRFHLEAKEARKTGIFSHLCLSSSHFLSSEFL